MKVYRSLRERMLALEMDLMLWCGHAFMVTVTIPMSHTHITRLGTYNGETPFKDSNTLIKASDEAISYSWVFSIVWVDWHFHPLSADVVGRLELVRIKYIVQMNRDSIIGINSRIMSRLSSHFLCSRLRDHKKKTVVLSSGSDVKVKVAPMSTINRSFLPKLMHIIKKMVLCGS